jgi:hypothetical protein
MKQPARLAKILALLIVALILCLGISALAFSWVSLASLQSWLSGATFDGKADFLTIGRYQKLVFGTRLLGAAFAILAVILWLLRRFIENLIKKLLTGVGEIVHDLIAAIKKDIKGEGAWHLAALALIVCAALALRLIFIGLPIRYDEATTYLEYASKPLPVLLSYYSSPNNHLFHSLLVHISTLFLGNGLLAIRLPALAAGWLIVPATYLLFRLLYDKQTGLMASALTAVCPVLVEFSSNARGYTLVSLFLLFILILLAHLRTKASLAGWFLVVVFSALGLWTVPVMMFPIAVACVWWLFSPPAGQRLLSWRRLKPLFLSMVAAALVTTLLYAPVAIGSGWETLLRASGSANRQMLQQVLPNVLFQPWTLMCRYLPDYLSIVLLGLLLAGFLAHWVLPHRGVWIGFAAIGGSIIVLMIVRTNPYNRVWLFAIPIILGICAVGLTWLLRQINVFKRSHNAFLVTISALTLILGVFTASSSGIRNSDEGGALRNAEVITKRISKGWRSGDAVLTACPADEPLAYHFKRQGMPVAPVFALLTGGLQNANRIWVVSKQPPGPTLVDLLKSAGDQVKGFNPPTIIERYPLTTLYLMDKLNTSQ